MIEPHEEKDLSRELLSQITIYNKYSKYLEKKGRRETWEELVNRNKNMHIKKYPELTEKINATYNNYVLTKKVLPSMRSMQFAGKPIEISPNRLYNCAFLPVDSIDTFSETMFLLLGGTGVGYSVQKHDVDKLPEIKQPNKNRTRRYLIADNIEGWADAIKMLFKSYTGKISSTILFDYSDIRLKGSKLITSGGKAPGPQPLKECLTKIRGILDHKQENEKLTTLESHDILCHIADAVLAGGIRRAAMIALFSLDDEEMMAAKTGNWWELNPQRGRANNSATVLRHKITKNIFYSLWERTQASKAGEPGIFLTNDKTWGLNPCSEIALRPYQFCNLTEINGLNIKTQEELNNRAEAASFIGTLQAGYTDFHYLREIWKKTTEKDALIGVSFTGLANKDLLNLNFEEASNIVVNTNKLVSQKIGINQAKRTTCIKPAGTTSLVLGTSSGIHAWHDPYYIRRIRLLKTEPLYNYLKTKLPELIEDEYFRPHDTAVLSIPQKSPDHAIYRNESAMNLLERIANIYESWVKPGHIDGQNTHNISATISVKEEEWDSVKKWMWENRNSYIGLTVLPYDGGNYKQAPFETCSKEKYEKLYKLLKNIDLREVNETEDLTNLTENLACSGNNCEVN